MLLGVISIQPSNILFFCTLRLLEGIWHYAGLMGGARESGRQSGAMFCALGEKTADHYGTYELTTGKPQARE